MRTAEATRAQLREQGGQIANLARSYADLVDAGVRQDRGYDELRRRVERIERRLELSE